MNIIVKIRREDFDYYIVAMNYYKRLPFCAGGCGLTEEEAMEDFYDCYNSMTGDCKAEGLYVPPLTIRFVRDKSLEKDFSKVAAKKAKAAAKKIAARKTVAKKATVKKAVLKKSVAAVANGNGGRSSISATKVVAAAAK